MSKTHRATLVAVLDALKLNGCVSDYTIDDHDGQPNWNNCGFDKAFDELKSNLRRPFGLKKKNERAWLMIVLAKKNKKAVDDWIMNAQ